MRWTSSWLNSILYIQLFVYVQCILHDLFLSTKFPQLFRQLDNFQLLPFKEPVLDVRVHTKFLLWTRQNPIMFQQIILNDATSLSTSNFVVTNPTKIYVHGFTENGRHISVRRLRDGILEREDCNFVSVDWQLLALPPDYFKAASHTQPVGTLTGDFVKFLLTFGVELRNLHLIGFSLGAHVVGRAGHLNNGTISRITGLDPAFPLFESVTTEARLDPTDGQFVDVIHTNAGVIKNGQVGFPFSIGHVDFWPNGGSFQPNCGDINTNEGDVQKIISIFRRGACSHRRAVQYFTESVIGATEFTATQCGSYAEFTLNLCDNNLKTAMGWMVSPRARGNFFLTTNNQSPFAQACVSCLANIRIHPVNR